MSEREMPVTHSPSRVFVLADCHGWPELIVNALRDIRSRYGGVREGVDRLVFAGDFLDRGPRAQECLDLIEALAGEVLWGNHDLAVTVGYVIKDQDPGSLRFQPGLRERLAPGRAGGGPEWKLVTEAGGVLISHAGVSSDYQADLDACGGDLAEFCRRLSEEHAEAVALEIRSGDWKSARTRGKRSPTRYKLEKYGAEGLLPASPRSSATRRRRSWRAATTWRRRWRSPRARWAAGRSPGALPARTRCTSSTRACSGASRAAAPGRARRARRARGARHALQGAARARLLPLCRHRGRARGRPRERSSLRPCGRSLSGRDDSSPIWADRHSGPRRLEAVGGARSRCVWCATSGR